MSAAKKPPAGKAEDAKQVTATYTVISPLSHDLVEYAAGDEVELTESQAAPLLRHTVIAKTDNTPEQS